MADWANFALYAISSLVTTLFGLDLGVGFSLGDAEVALFIVGLIASGFIIKIGGAGASAIINHPKSRESNMNDIYGKGKW